MHESGFSWVSVVRAWSPQREHTLDLSCRRALVKRRAATEQRPPRRIDQPVSDGGGDMCQLSDVVEKLRSGGAIATNTKELFAGPPDSFALLHAWFASVLAGEGLIHLWLLLGGAA